MTTLAKNVPLVLEQIQQFERLYARAPGAVKLLAVSKQQSAEAIRDAQAAGLSDFGENYLQEAEAKIVALKDLSLTWHFIGPIQSNKTRGIAAHFDWVHSIDREKIATRLDAQRDSLLGPLNVCVQINLSAEATKSGIELAACRDLCAHVNTLPNLRLRGLMAIPAPHQDFATQRAGFHELAAEFAALAVNYPTMDTLSMGMSNDFEAAIAEGSTLVRIGTALFGERDRMQ